ncbi:acyl-coenzyme A thioesterase THEM4 isoform X2 [Plectropomus leopardus]|uniref:acyl-coenzyme A thioesterase THEM4 isoform X2 n=1 Tax=Plectropomus leopardus TaxID=160734 RepID=UPI001C4DC84E|nr:acyl-coenzyme A thioesterase THEM4 isoform X2 [Plectropomus leopardus]
MARSLGGLCESFQRLGSLFSAQTHLSLPPSRASVRSVSARAAAPQDFSLPNSSWSSEMMRLYEHYNSQCEVETEGGQKRRGPWRRLPSYSQIEKYPSGGMYRSKTVQSKSCFFTRNIKDQGEGFEYVLFINNKEQKGVCIFQAGPLLEGAPGHVHGGAIATMVDTLIGTQAAFLFGPVLTANLNINYRSPIPLGSTVLLESSVDKKEGRKTFMSCKVTSTDGSKVHTETTALFLSINASNLVPGA